MAVYSVVQHSCLDLSTRIDAEHYSPRFTPILRQLARLRTVKLRRTLLEPVKTGHTPPTKNQAYYDSEVVKFIKTDNLREDRIDTYDVQYLSELGNSKIAASELKLDDVIVTIIGATEEIIGRAARIHRDLGRANINQNIALIRSRVPAGYLTVFLNSRYGREQLIWLSRQTGQVNLNCREIEELAIPLFSDKFIATVHTLNDRRHKLLSGCVQIYTQAEQLLLSELGLLDWKPARTLTFVGSYRDAAQVQRTDAEHFHPKYAELRACIRSYANGYLKITDISKNSDETIEPRADPEKDFNYVELAAINQVIGTIESANTIKGKDAPSRARMLLRTGDVIASTVEGSLDKVALVSEEHDGAIGSTGFFVLRPRTVPSGYLLALAKSILVREQMRCESSGTILAAVPGRSLQNIIVPNLPPDKRDEIARLVQQSHTARREAKALLEKAKRAVEIAIEEGEERAMEFIG